MKHPISQKPPAAVLADMPLKPSKHVQNAIDSMQKKDSVRLNVNVSQAFYKDIKQAALDSDQSISEFVIEAIQGRLSVSK